MTKTNINMASIGGASGTDVCSLYTLIHYVKTMLSGKNSRNPNVPCKVERVESNIFEYELGWKDSIDALNETLKNVCHESISTSPSPFVKEKIGFYPCDITEAIEKSGMNIGTI